MQDGSEYDWWRNGRDIFLEIGKELDRFNNNSSRPLSPFKVVMSKDLEVEFNKFVETFTVPSNDSPIYHEGRLLGLNVYFLASWPPHTIRVY